MCLVNVVVQVKGRGFNLRMTVPTFIPPREHEAVTMNGARREVSGSFARDREGGTCLFGSASRTMNTFNGDARICSTPTVLS